MGGDRRSRTTEGSIVDDNDFAPFSATDNVVFTVSDASGNLLATQSGPTTTPPAR